MNSEYRTTDPVLSNGQTCLPQCDSAGRACVDIDRGPVAPARTAAAVTPSDSAANIFTSLYIGGTGNVCVDMAVSGTNIVFSAVPAGSWLPISVVKVKASTTATLIVGVS